MTDSGSSPIATDPKQSADADPPLESPEAHFKHIVVKHPDNGIHDLVFIDSTAETVDELFEYLTYLNLALKPGQTYRQLWDARVGLLPISKTIQESRKFIARFPATAAHRIAVIYPQRQNTLLNPGSVLLNMLPLGRLKIRYFSEKHYELGVQWLLSDK